MLDDNNISTSLGSKYLSFSKAWILHSSHKAIREATFN